MTLFYDPNNFDLTSQLFILDKKADKRPRKENNMKEINLKEGDGIKILPETKEFLFKCCDCGLTHKIKVKREKESIVLIFFRE